MCFDQTIQIANTIGIWLAAFATVAAVVVSLYLARRAEKVRLKIYVGIRLILDNSSENYFAVMVTNLGERKVTISNISGSIGKGKNKSSFIIPDWSLRSSSLPSVLEHGGNANFCKSIIELNWLENFKNDLCKGHDIKTLRFHVWTSTGFTKKVKPEENFLKLLGDDKKK